ncbi:unnamed protein product [Hymenolepis diminuta]|uniref:Uncharacterized protein n=1 Tax=Hymenolepis diminuta TaxID=6216 RepID=A0A564YES2_HYMDI|nr:unnamed protein product [Hymenolepis diminuta]
MADGDRDRSGSRKQSDQPCGSSHHLILETLFIVNKDISSANKSHPSFSLVVQARSIETFKQPVIFNLNSLNISVLRLLLRNKEIHKNQINLLYHLRCSQRDPKLTSTVLC